ncbi:MAG: hypothetical protein IKY33_01675 [Clostridia bacterium]|nr:hypothetical protein [Clostridia bacterium]
MKSKIALAYRLPMAVSKSVRFPNACYYPVCPHCSCTMEREYQSYCDRCGQALSWKVYKP